MGFGITEDIDFTPLNIAVLIVSDTRTSKTDTSGAILQEMIESAGHTFAGRKIIPDEVDGIRQTIDVLIQDPSIQVVISSGGTGLTGRDNTPEAVRPLFQKEIEGFSIIFHHVSFQTVGLSTLQSRALAGLTNHTLIFCLPGSNGAVRDGWNKIISQQLDSRYKPCNLVKLTRATTIS